MTSPRAIFTRLGRVFNVPAKVAENGAGVTFEIPGWSFTDFCRTGKPGLWNICSVIESQRMVGYVHPSYIYTDLPRDGDPRNSIAVVAAQKLRIHRALYQQAALSSPTVIKVVIDNVGKSSFDRTLEARAKETGDLLCTYVRRQVFIDPTTRKPTGVPASFVRLRDEVRPLRPDPPATATATAVHEASSLHVAVKDPPADSHRYTLRAHASDLDHLRHVTAYVYPRYCLDAAYDAVVAKPGAFRHFGGRDICEYEVASMDIRYLGETLYGDLVTVQVWEDEVRERTLNFYLTVGKRKILYCNMSFYELTD